MHYQQGGEYPIHVSRGSFCIKERKNWEKCICSGGALHQGKEKLGEMHLFQEKLAFMLLGALFHLNLSWTLLPMVSSPFASP
jgi:hypothetical protein